MLNSRAYFASVAMGSLALMAFSTNAFAQNQADTTHKNIVIDEQTKQEIKQLNDEVSKLNKQVSKLNATLGAGSDTSKSSKFIEMDGNVIKLNLDAKSNFDGLGVDSMKAAMGERKKHHRMFHTQWLDMVDIGLNTYSFNNNINLPEQYKLFNLNTGRSIEVNWHLVEQGMSLTRSHKLYLTYGVMINYNNYMFSNNVSFKSDTTYTMPYLDQKTNYTKVKLATQYLTVPLMLHFETKPFRSHRSFEIAAGGEAGLLVDSYLKQVSDEYGKHHYHNDYNLSGYKYSLTAKIGYGNFGQLYFSYSLSNLFKSGMGPDLTPISFGIILNRFNWS